MESVESVTPLPTYARQRKQIKSRVDDVFEEIALNENLFGNLREHATQMMHIMNISSPESFPSIFAEAYSSLSKYSQILIEINCKLEALLMKEVSQWNSKCIREDSKNVKPFTLDSYKGKITQIKAKPAPNTPTVKQQKQSSKCVTPKSDGKSICRDPAVKPQSVKVCKKNSKNEKLKSASDKNGQKTQKRATDTPKQKPPKKTRVKVEAKKKNSEKACSTVAVKNKKNLTKPDLVVQEKQTGQVRQVIENTNLSINTKYEGHVVLMISPLEFYVYFVVQGVKENYEKELEAFRKNYQFPAKPKGKTIVSRKMTVSSTLGDYALLYLEPAFLRVKIEDWCVTKNDDKVTVSLIDLGGMKSVSIYNLHPIPKELMKFPAFATRCHLAHVPKEAGRMQNVTDYFRSWINKTGIVGVEIGDRRRSPIQGSIPVVIWDNSTNSCINEMIISKINGSPKKANDPVEKWDPMWEAYTSNMNMYDFDVDDPAALIYGYVSKDYDRVCKLYGNTGKCYKMACKKEHVLLDPKGYTTDKEKIYVRALNPLKIPRVKVLNVRVTHIESPSSFYCILDLPKSDTKEETLLSLYSYMNQSRNISEMKKMLIPPAVGQVIIVKSPENNSWYRARVLSVLPELDECTILCVDQGNRLTVNFSCIRAMEPRYLHLPFQAIFCEICGIADQPATFSQAVRYLNDSLTELSRIEIMSFLPGEHPHLLVNLYTSKGDNMAEKLLANKLVARKENILLDDTKMYLPG